MVCLLQSGWENALIWEKIGGDGARPPPCQVALGLVHLSWRPSVSLVIQMRRMGCCQAPGKTGDGVILTYCKCRNLARAFAFDLRKCLSV